MVRSMQFEYLPKDNSWHIARRWRRPRHDEMIEKVYKRGGNVFLAPIKVHINMLSMIG